MRQTVPITLGKKIKQASIQCAIGGYEHKSESIHLSLRDLGLAQDQVQYKHNKWCCVHQQVCGKQSDSELYPPLLSLMRGTQQMLVRLGQIAQVWCSVWYFGGRSTRGQRPVNSVDDELSLW